MSKGIFIKNKNEWKKVKNVWMKIDGNWKKNIIPKCNINGKIKETLSYFTDWIKVNKEFNSSQFSQIFVDTKNEIMILTTLSFGESTISIFILSIKDGTIIKKIQSPSCYKLYNSYNCWYENKSIYYISSYKQLSIVKVDIETGYYNLIYSQFSNSSDSYTNTTICKNKNLVLYGYQLDNSNWNLNNHGTIFDLKSGKSSRLNSGNRISKILPYKNDFIGIHHGYYGNYYLAEHNNFKLNDDRYAETSLLEVSKNNDEYLPDFGIDYNEDFCFVVNTSGFAYKYDLKNKKIILQKNINTRTYYDISLSINETKKQIYITYNWTDDIKIFDYDFNLITELKTDLKKDTPKKVKVDNLGYTLFTNEKIERFQNKLR